MKTPTLIVRIVSGIILLTALAGCNLTVPSPTPTPTETVDIQPTLNAVKTQAVGTAMAILTKNAPTATETRVPTSTNTPQPTAMATATRTLAPLWTWTPTLPAGGCSIISASPEYNSVFDPNASFDGRWEIKNKSDGSWLQNEVDIRYVSGTKFQTKEDAVDLSGDVGEEETTTVIVDMQTPANAGTYVTNWAVYRGGEVLCGLSLTIRVQ